MAIAERYIDAFSKLAKTNNTMLLPSETGDVSTMVAKVRYNLVSEKHLMYGT